MIASSRKTSVKHSQLFIDNKKTEISRKFFHVWCVYLFLLR